MKIYMQFITTILFLFGLFWCISYLSQAEWLVVGKYYLTAIVVSFFAGFRLGIHLFNLQFKKARLSRSK